MILQKNKIIHKVITQTTKRRPKKRIKTMQLKKKVKIMKILTMIKLNQVERATINITLIKMIIIKVIQKENKPKIKKKVI